MMLFVICRYPDVLSWFWRLHHSKPSCFPKSVPPVPLVLKACRGVAVSVSIYRVQNITWYPWKTFMKSLYGKTAWFDNIYIKPRLMIIGHIVQSYCMVTFMWWILTLWVDVQIQGVKKEKVKLSISLLKFVFNWSSKADYVWFKMTKNNAWRLFVVTLLM